MEELNKVIIDHLIIRDKLDKPNRNATLCNKRWYLFDFMHSRGMTLMAIGKKFNKHHATVLVGIKKYKDLQSSQDPKLKDDIAYYSQCLEAIPIKLYDLKEDIIKAEGIKDLEVIKKRIQLDLYK